MKLSSVIFFLGIAVQLAPCGEPERIANGTVAPAQPLHPVALTLLPIRGNAAESNLLSPATRYAELTQPPGPRLRVEAEFLGTRANADRWKLTISPQSGPKETKEVEYTGEPIVVWSRGAQHVLLTKDSLAVFKLRQSGTLGEEQQKGTR